MRIIIPIFMLLSFNAHAEHEAYDYDDVSHLNYSYIQAGGGSKHHNGMGDESQLQFKASLALSDMAFLHGRYDSYSVNDDRDEREEVATNLTAGVGMLFPMTADTAIVVSSGYRIIENKSVDNDSADGVGVGAGFRGVTNYLEYEILYSHYTFDEKVRSEIAVNGAYFLDETIAITTSLEHDYDNKNSYTFGLRLGF